jgi:hypothetical protein
MQTHSDFYRKDIHVTTRVRSLILGAAAAVIASSAAGAQLPIPRFGIVGGVSNSPGSGGNQSNPIGALRVDLPIILFLAEGSLGVTRSEIDGVRRTYIIPEAQAQWQLLPTLVRPYIGVGGGVLKPLSGGTTTATYSASAGVRAGLPLLPISFRAEARVRAGSLSGSFKRQATEFTVGVTF